MVEPKVKQFVIASGGFGRHELILERKLKSLSLSRSISFHLSVIGLSLPDIESCNTNSFISKAYPTNASKNAIPFIWAGTFLQCIPSQQSVFRYAEQLRTSL